jgi:hypothetical protein
MPKIVVALFVLRRLRPVKKVRLLAFGLLREKIVCEPDRKLLCFRELLNHRIIFRIVLKTTARIDRTRDSESIELAHEVAC